MTGYICLATELKSRHAGKDQVTKNRATAGPNSQSSFKKKMVELMMSVYKVEACRQQLG